MTIQAPSLPWVHLERLSLPEDHALMHAYLGERLASPLPSVEALLGAAPHLEVLRLRSDPPPAITPGGGDLLLALLLTGGGAVTLRMGGALAQCLLSRLADPPAAPAPPLSLTPAEAGLLSALVAAALVDLAGGAAILDGVWTPTLSEGSAKEPRSAHLEPSLATPSVAPVEASRCRALLHVETHFSLDGQAGGWLLASLDAAATEALRTQARRHPPPLAAARASGLPLTCDLIVATAFSSADEAAHLAPGDVLAFPHVPPAGSGDLPAHLTLGAWCCPCRLRRTTEGRHLLLTDEETSMPRTDLDPSLAPLPSADPAHGHGQGSPTRGSPPPGSFPPGSPTPGSPTPGSPTPGRLETLPVRLSVSLGNVTLSAAEVMRLTPGAVIPLAEPMGGFVEVLAGGQKIARGELVEVDGSLGVRLTTLYT